MAYAPKRKKLHKLRWSTVSILCLLEKSSYCSLQRWNKRIKVTHSRRLSLVHTRYHPLVHWLNPEQGVSTEYGKKKKKKVVQLSAVASKKKKNDNWKGNILNYVSIIKKKIFFKKYILHNRDLHPVLRDSNLATKLDPTFRRRTLSRYPEVPRGNFPQNAINPNLTRIFLA